MHELDWIIPEDLNRRLKPTLCRQKRSSMFSKLRESENSLTETHFTDLTIVEYGDKSPMAEHTDELPVG